MRTRTSDKSYLTVDKGDAHRSFRKSHFNDCIGERNEVLGRLFETKQSEASELVCQLRVQSRSYMCEGCHCRPKTVDKTEVEQ